MTRWAVAAGGALLLVTGAGACATAGSGTPATGPGGGPVEVRPSAAPTPGATITIFQSSEDADHGSACSTLDEWVDGGWRSRWYWERSSPEPIAIPDGEERTCPAIGVPLPTEQTVAMPDDIKKGIWRLAYVAGEDDLGTYVFAVG